MEDLIFLYQCVDVGFGNGIYIFYDLIYRIDRDAFRRSGRIKAVTGSCDSETDGKRLRFRRRRRLEDGGYAMAVRIHPASFSCTFSFAQWPTMILRSIPIRLTMCPYSLSPCADWFSFMKSIWRNHHARSKELQVLVLYRLTGSVRGRMPEKLLQIQKFR